MKASSTLLLLLTASHHATAVVDKWTPADFDWSARSSRYGIATQNVTSKAVTKELVVFAADNHDMDETSLSQQQALAIPVFLGVGLRVVSWLSSAAGLVSTGIGCYEVIKSALGGEQTTPESKTSCALGAAGGVLGFGAAAGAKYLQNKAAAAAAARAFPPSLPPVELGQDFLESIELAQFGKRDAMKRSVEGRGLSPEQEWDQHYHNHFTSKLIRDAKLGNGDFLGYVHEKHPLSRRDGVHPLTPRFRFDHPKHGPMVLSTKVTNTTSHYTVEPFIEGNPGVSKRWQEQYRKEVLEDGRIVEARFDHEAFNADPGDISVDAANTFVMAEDAMHCMLGGDGWPLDQVIDAQFYDDANKATFAYASVGVFNDQSHDGDLGGLAPQPPVSGGEDC